ncbi:MAG: hypothetical protein R2709_16010 [Marmoricola sp.]
MSAKMHFWRLEAKWGGVADIELQDAMTFGFKALRFGQDRTLTS